MNDPTMKTNEHFGLMDNHYHTQSTSLASELADFATLIWYNRIILDYHDPCHTRYNTQDENADNDSFPLPSDTYLTNYDGIQPFEMKETIVLNEQVMSTTVQPSPLFRLLEQPHFKQRKCYKSENRYVLPNPLVICPLQSPLPIEGGNVSVKLTNNNGTPLDSGVLDNSCPLEKTLDQNQLCLFTLKILENSPAGNPFRLQFDVTYTTTQRETFTETILSDPFAVMSNKCIKIKAPRVEGILPKYGPSHATTELWIKGRYFSSRGVVVLVDGQTAQVLHISSNLVSVLIPARKELRMNTAVDIVVMNRWRTKKSIISENVLRFTYLVGRRTKPLFEDLAL